MCDFHLLPQVLNLLPSSIIPFIFPHTYFCILPHFSFPVILWPFVPPHCPLFASSSLLSPLKKSILFYFLHPFFLYFYHSCITLISTPLFSPRPVFPPCSPFSFTSFDIWRRVGLHSADEERGDDVTADVVHQHLLWSKNTHHRTHTVSLQLHSAFVSTSMHYWDGPAFTQLGLMGMRGYMPLDQNWYPWCVTILRLKDWRYCR